MARCSIILRNNYNDPLHNSRHIIQQHNRHYRHAHLRNINVVLHLLRIHQKNIDRTKKVQPQPLHPYPQTAHLQEPPHNHQLLPMLLSLQKHQSQPYPPHIYHCHSCVI